MDPLVRTIQNLRASLLVRRRQRRRRFGLEVEHTPSRPKWVCAACHGDWPCAPAKTHLSEEYEGAEGALLMYLGFVMWDAFDDGLVPIGEDRHVVPPTLRERFIDWYVVPLISRRANAS